MRDFKDELFCIGQFKDKKTIGVRYQSMINTLTALVTKEVSIQELTEDNTGRVMMNRILNLVQNLEGLQKEYKHQIQSELEKQAPKPTTEQRSPQSVTALDEGTKDNDVPVPAAPALQEDQSSEDEVTMDELEELGSFEDDTEGLDFDDKLN